MWRRVARGWEVVGPTSLRIIHISEATADELRARRAIAPWLLRDLLASGPETAELIAEMADQSLVSNPFGGSGAPTDDQIHELLQGIEAAFERGEFIEALDAGAPVPPVVAPRERPPKAEASAAPAPSRAAKTGLHSFAVRWVDEVGEGIGDVALEFAHDTEEEASTDKNGVARVEDTPSTSASVHVADVQTLLDGLEERWKGARDREWLTEADGVTVLTLPRDDALPTYELATEKLRIISVQPYVVRVRLIGGFFDTSKSFVLPAGLDGLRRVARMYEEERGSKLLVVGHTDTAGNPAYNDPLSLERAEAMKAYLTDDVDAWLAWYDSGNPAEKRWGKKEDHMMIDALPDASTRHPTEARVHWFQRTRGLELDGIAGPETRRALVEEYMALDGTSLPPDIELVTHGCGENFPQHETGDGVEDADNRRVEFFFFDGRLGILPPPPGTNSASGAPEYPEWARRSVKSLDIPLNVRKVIVQVIDVEGKVLGNAPYELVAGVVTRSGRSDSDGNVFEEHIPAVDTCFLKWGYPPEPGKLVADSPVLQFERTLVLNYDPAPTDEGAQTRLLNLGYASEDLQENVRAFQQDFALPEAAWFDQKTWDELHRVHDLAADDGGPKA